MTPDAGQHTGITDHSGMIIFETIIIEINKERLFSLQSHGRDVLLYFLYFRSEQLLRDRKPAF